MVSAISSAVSAVQSMGAATPAANALAAVTGDPAIAQLSAQTNSGGGTSEDIQMSVYQLDLRQSAGVLKLLDAIGNNIDTHA